jgi:hypothetical protein
MGSRDVLLRLWESEKTIIRVTSLTDPTDTHEAIDTVVARLVCSTIIGTEHGAGSAVPGTHVDMFLMCCELWFTNGGITFFDAAKCHSAYVGREH